MRRSTVKSGAIMTALALVAPIGAGCAAVDAEPACGRDCLLAVADDYLAALAANDPGRAPLADELVFVENITRLAPGEGLWASAAGPASDFMIRVPDPVAGTVGVMTVIDRRTAGGVTPAQLALRLEVADGEIVEAEHIVADLGSEADLAGLAAPRPALTADVAQPQRMDRDEIARIAGSYYEALVQSDGSLAPFAADCERQENGTITAAFYLEPATFESVDVEGRSPPPVARDCEGQVSSRRFAYIDAIDNRRVFAIDPVQGLAMGFSHFRQSMARGPHRMIAADGVELMWEEAREPYDLPAAHVFKIAGGEIHEVEAVGIFTPYASRRAGSSNRVYPQSRAEPKSEAAV